MFDRSNGRRGGGFEGCGGEGDVVHGHRGDAGQVEFRNVGTGHDHFVAGVNLFQEDNAEAVAVSNGQGRAVCQVDNHILLF